MVARRVFIDGPDKSTVSSEACVQSQVGVRPARSALVFGGSGADAEKSSRVNIRARYFKRRCMLDEVRTDVSL